MLVAVPVFLQEAPFENAVVAVLEGGSFAAVLAVELAQRQREFALFLREACQRFFDFVYLRPKTSEITFGHSLKIDAGKKWMLLKKLYGFQIMS